MLGTTPKGKSNLRISVYWFTDNDCPHQHETLFNNFGTGTETWFNTSCCAATERIAKAWGGQAKAEGRMPEFKYTFKSVIANLHSQLWVRSVVGTFTNLFSIFQSAESSAMLRLIFFDDHFRLSKIERQNQLSIKLKPWWKATHRLTLNAQRTSVGLIPVSNFT